jgi:hypothetical protein
MTLHTTLYGGETGPHGFLRVINNRQSKSDGQGRLEPAGSAVAENVPPTVSAVNSVVYWFGTHPSNPSIIVANSLYD